MEKIKLILLTVFASAFLFCALQCGNQSNKVEFVRNDAEKKVDVMIDGRLFTSFLWHEPAMRDIKKPALYPIITSTGTEITRGYPLNPRQGERHSRQVKDIIV